MTTRSALLAALLCPAAALAAPGDRAGCADHPLFPTRMPEYTLTECKTASYDTFTFLKMKAPALTQEGKLTSLFYQAPPQKGAAALEIVRNYEAAITKAGGTVVDIDTRHFVYGKFVQAARKSGPRPRRGQATTSASPSSRRRPWTSTSWPTRPRSRTI